MPDGMPTRVKDGIAWPVGSERDVQWISNGTGISRGVTAAIPPVFAAYATLVRPGEPGVPRDVRQERQQDFALVEVLRRHTRQLPCWLGYLDTGASDIVFWDAPKVMLYMGWHYVLIEAGPEQAAKWRPTPGGKSTWKSTELPDLMFPEDHAWLVSALWDDDRSGIGGSEELIADLLRDPVLGPHARRISIDQDATPPGHAAQYHSHSRPYLLLPHERGASSPCGRGRARTSAPTQPAGRAAAGSTWPPWRQTSSRGSGSTRALPAFRRSRCLGANRRLSNSAWRQAIAGARRARSQTVLLVRFSGFGAVDRTSLFATTAA